MDWLNPSAGMLAGLAAGRECGREEIGILEERVREVETALRNLVKINEEHNAAIEGIIGRTPGWNDGYLDEARRVLGEVE